MSWNEGLRLDLKKDFLPPPPREMAWWDKGRGS